MPKFLNLSNKVLRYHVKGSYKNFTLKKVKFCVFEQDLLIFFLYKHMLSVHLKNNGVCTKPATPTSSQIII